MSPFRSRGERASAYTGLEGAALPKWSGLVVAGNDVTEEVAAAIIIRTGGFDFLSNEAEFERELYRELGVRVESKNGRARPSEKDLARAKAKYRVLDLLRLRNHRVVSCWIGGPHGWCDWSGKIGACTYNIGKYPESIGVLDEWAVIAAAFPGLSLTCQLLSGEIGEEGSRPVVEYIVGSGGAKMKRPGKPIVPEAETAARCNEVIDGFAERLTRGAEIGCSIEAFRKALKMTIKYNTRNRSRI